MRMYSYVQSLVEGLEIDELITIDSPVKLKAFRKFLSEIAKKDHKKFTTAVKGSQLHIMRVKHYSMAEKLNP